MFVVGNIFIALAQLLHMALTLLKWLIIIRALISWVNPDPYNMVVQFLHRVTEPILMPIRRFIPMSGIDLSPIIAFFLIIAVEMVVVQSLFDFGLRMKM